jgi:hypothetical protein
MPGKMLREASGLHMHGTFEGITPEELVGAFTPVMSSSVGSGRDDSRGRPPVVLDPVPLVLPDPVLPVPVLLVPPSLMSDPSHFCWAALSLTPL